VKETVDALRTQFGDAAPRVLLVLGSGLGALADSLENSTSVDFGDVPGFARAAVVGHKGRIVCGTLEGVSCIAMQGRYHLYEGHSAAAATLPVRAISELGVDTMIVTNAAGGVNRSLRAGTLMLIEDHINLMGQNPLVGPALPGETRFPDMTTAYDVELRALADRVAAEQGIALGHGVYCALMGPTYETPAEVRMLERLGADAVGMSTVPEVIVARARGLRVLGISLITNEAAGYSGEVLSHTEVITAGAQAAESFARLVRGVLSGIAATPRKP
jgi:purine-nucleoside phosphorylase